MPKLFATALILFSTLLILRSLVVEALFVRAARRSSRAAPPEREVDGVKFTLREHFRAVGVLAFGALYLILLPYVGYILGVILLVTSLAIYMGTKPSPKVVGIAALVAVIFYLLFVQLLSIPLPAGIWPTLLG